MIAVVSHQDKLHGEVKLPGDKSMSHRALIMSALVQGKSLLENVSEATDCMSTVKCLRSLGTEFIFDNHRIEVAGKGMKLKPPTNVLDAGNSGTTARLLLGVLAGQSFRSRLKGDQSLSKRPMSRVVEPLRRMGADIQGGNGGDKLPLRVRGGSLYPMEHYLEVASAQVKSALLLAGLFTEGSTVVQEPFPSRDHTERMLNDFGVEVETKNNSHRVKGPVHLQPCRLKIPGDISSAIFLVVAAALTPQAEVTIKEVGVNPTRIGALEVLEEMGVKVVRDNYRWLGNEPVADLHVKGGSSLRSVKVGPEMIPRLVDEVPALCVAALKAQGKTVIEGAGELRVKESDRISTLTQELRKIGAKVEEKPDGIIVNGGYPLMGNHCYSHGDHRIAMALAVAGIVAQGETSIDGFEAVQFSFPGFMHTLRTLLDKV